MQKTIRVQSSPFDAAAESAGLGEIIVTAQKRTEDVKEVPASISVIGGAALEEALEALRRLPSDPDAVYRRLMFTKSLETPALL